MNAAVEESIDDAESYEAAVGRDGDPDVVENDTAGAEEQEGVEGAKVIVC